ncbi:MAG: DUF1320 family protein [archaeon]|nr:DUF1320 family protein [archaeon]
MPYSTRNMVKERLGIDATNNSYDSIIDSKIIAADAVIDNSLKQYTSIPLSNPPQIISDISADLASGLFRQDRAPPNENNFFLERGEKELQDYITLTYLKPVFKKSEGN